MKKLLLIITIIFLITPTIFAQLNKGSLELSFSAYGGSTKYKYQVKDSKYSQNNYESDTRNFFTLYTRLDYYFLENLSLVPEFHWSAFDGDAPTYFFTANLSYNLTQINKLLVPFIIVGFGIGNGEPMWGLSTEGHREKFDVKLFNIGSGLKILINKNVALRFEYRFQRHSYPLNSHFFISNDSIETEYIASSHRTLFGISFFL